MVAKNVSVSGTSINVLDVGSGQPILFVHGFPLDHSMWRFQVDELADRYRLICPDLPGFGASPARPTAMSMKGFADDLAGLLEALDIDQPVVYCGLSMGGYIGWQFWKHHCNKLSHLVACDTRAAGDSEQVARGRRIGAKTVIQTGSTPVADAMLEKLFFQPGGPAKKEITEQSHSVISTTDPASIAGGQLAMAERPDATGWLSEIKVPTLFAVGEHDSITPAQEMRENAGLVTGSTFLEISNAGHMAPLENPVEFNRGLIEFLNRSS